LSTHDDEAPDKTAPVSGLTVRDNREASRYELPVDGHVAFLEYERRPHSIVLKHTEVPESLRGRGLGAILAKSALAIARAEGLRVVVHCPFVKAYLEQHPELAQPLKP
jgi:uncharacterized protein